MSHGKMPGEAFGLRLDDTRTLHRGTDDGDHRKFKMRISSPSTCVMNIMVFSAITESNGHASSGGEPPLWLRRVHRPEGRTRQRVYKLLNVAKC